MKKLLLSLLVSLSVSGLAFAEGDPAAGQAKAAICANCHMADGNSLAPTFPKLAGQHASYIAKQLKDIKTNQRVAPAMIAFAAMLTTDADIENVAAYYASQTVTTSPAPGATPEMLELGKNIYTDGLTDKGVAACAACHSPTGEGNALAKFPQLKGQHAMYTEQQLKAFAAGTRANDPGSMMRDLASKMSEEEIKAVAAYIQGM